MTTLTQPASPSAAGRARQWLRERNVPPVYGILVIIFIVSVLLDAIFGIDDQLFILNQTILTNILVRSVALGIVAVGQTFVMLGASIDLSVAYLISVTAVGASYLMAGDPNRVWWTVLVLFVIGIAVGLLNGTLVTRLRKVPGVGVVRLTAADVVRHPLVQRIIEAYKGREKGIGNGEAG